MSYNRKAGGGGGTAWSKNKSSVPSDALKPKAKPPQNAQPQRSTASKGKAKEVKSKEIQRIEALIQSIESGVDEKGGNTGCFCLARTHILSLYTPICPHCGLIMCELQKPSSPCPSCLSPILSSTERSALISRLESEKAAILRQEEDRREAERLDALRQEEIRKGGGAFPTLAVAVTGIGGGGHGGSHSGTSTPRGVGTASGRQTPAYPSDTDGPHKVLSLNSRTKKVVVSTYKTLPPPARLVKPSADEETEIERATRVPPPPDEVQFISGERPDDRKWFNLRGSITYVPLQPANVPHDQEADEAGEGTEGKKRRRRKRDKGKEKGGIV